MNEEVCLRDSWVVLVKAGSFPWADQMASSVVLWRGFPSDVET